MLAHLQLDLLQGGCLLHTLQYIQGFGDIDDDVFSSSHVAAACAILFSTHRYECKIFYFLLIPILGPAVYTVSCRYHYGIDVLADALLGISFYFIGMKLYQSWQRKTGSIFKEEKIYGKVLLDESRSNI